MAASRWWLVALVATGCTATVTPGPAGHKTVVPSKVIAKKSPTPSQAPAYGTEGGGATAGGGGEEAPATDTSDHKANLAKGKAARVLPELPNKERLTDGNPATAWDAGQNGFDPFKQFACFLSLRPAAYQVFDAPVPAASCDIGSPLASLLGQAGGGLQDDLKRAVIVTIDLGAQTFVQRVRIYPVGDRPGIIASFKVIASANDLPTGSGAGTAGIAALAPLLRDLPKEDATGPAPIQGAAPAPIDVAIQGAAGEKSKSARFIAVLGLAWRRGPGAPPPSSTPPSAPSSNRPTATGSLSPTASGSLSPTASGSLSPSATGSLSPTASGSLSPSGASQAYHVQGGLGDLLGSLGGGGGGGGGLSPDLLSKLPPDALAALPPSTLAKLPPEILAKLPPEIRAKIPSAAPGASAPPDAEATPEPDSDLHIGIGEIEIY